MINTVLLVLAALVPAVILGIYIFVKDRVEKEPFGLLAILFISGIVICYPVVKVSPIINGVIDNFFSLFAVSEDGTSVYLSSGIFTVYKGASNFLGVALIEEGFKWLAMYLITHKNKNFNSLFDGMIYAVFVSLGFAAFENILYAFSYGWNTVLMRAFTAVPGHVFDAVFMGYYYSLWHVYNKARNQERELKSRGLIEKSQHEFKSAKYLVLSIVVPVAAHGFYDFCLDINRGYMVIVFYAFLIFLYFFCFSRVRKLSKMDSSDSAFSTSLVIKKHPQLVSVISDLVPGANTGGPQRNSAFVRPDGLPRTATVADIIDEYKRLHNTAGTAVSTDTYIGQTEFVKQK